MKRTLSALVLAALLGSALSPAMAEDRVDLQLTYPNGRSPKVFTQGWTFGAKAVLNPGTPGAKDISSQVRWSGSGAFDPAVGSLSHPTFSREGTNTIEISVTLNQRKFSAKFTLEAVKPFHATVGDQAASSSDAHGCPACPHPVVGPILTGNKKVLINGRPVACVGDTGIHGACCGPNTFKIIEGDPYVLVDGRPVAKLGCKTQHCGSVGQIISVNGAGKTEAAVASKDGAKSRERLGNAGRATEPKITTKAEPKNKWVAIGTKVYQEGIAKCSAGGGSVDRTAFVTQGSWSTPPGTLTPGQTIELTCSNKFTSKSDQHGRYVGGSTTWTQDEAGIPPGSATRGHTRICSASTDYNKKRLSDTASGKFVVPEGRPGQKMQLRAEVTDGASPFSGVAFIYEFK